MFEERSMKLVDENGGFELYQAYDHTIDRHGKTTRKTTSPWRRFSYEMYRNL